MAYADIQLFMHELNQLMTNCNDNNPFINNPEIIREKPQFQFLHQDLGFIVQTLSNYERQDLQEQEKLNDLKKRFKDAAEEAEYIVDLFLSGVQKVNSVKLELMSIKMEYSSQRHKRKLNQSPPRNSRISFKSVLDLVLSCVQKRYFPSSSEEEDIKPFLSLDDVRGSFNSVKVELMTMKMDSSQIHERNLNQSATATVLPRNSLGPKKTVDEINVGIDDDAKLDVISIVGMGGIGKTTLATKVFNDDYVKYHFHVRVWVTVSQTYDKRNVLIQILESISGESNLGVADDCRLRELVHKKLMGRRYLIVIDDIWHIETWDKLKLFFPHDSNGSRILLTSRQIDVAKHATSDHGLIHPLGYLNKEKGWELLCKKVFHGNECPECLIKPGMQIVENCKGLPLAVAVIAGVLAKETWSEEFWVEIANRTGSYIVGDQNGSVMETLALSYNHLPFHLRECLLYLGGFPEDYEFHLRWLIWVWMAEGFIQQDGDRSLEDIAEGYLMDLIDRNLVIVADKSNSNIGAIKACKVHDLVRELCLRKAEEEQFIIQTHEDLKSSVKSSDVITLPYKYKPVRMFINKDTFDPDFAHLSSQNLHSILWFNVFRLSRHKIEKYLRSFVLLRVLDLQNYILEIFPKDMELLVHLRYLAIRKHTGFPSSICKLWGLQTLIYCARLSQRTTLPSNISDLVNLRHLLSYSPIHGSWGSDRYFALPSIEKPMNLLQTFSDVMLGDGVDIQKCFPYIKKLGIHPKFKHDFKSLTYLEKLRLISGGMEHMITLPATLKRLTLKECRLPWSEMSIIQSLPNLQVLKLHFDAFSGSCWNIDEDGRGFPQLQFLRLKRLDIKQWKAAADTTTTFPCLKQLQIDFCLSLEEIPLEIGEIPTLELIQISRCKPSVGESVRRIQQHQQDFYGNYDLKVDVSPDLTH